MKGKPQLTKIGEPYLPVPLCQWESGVFKYILSPEIAEMEEMAGIAQKTQISRIGTQFLSLEPNAFLDHIE